MEADTSSSLVEKQQIKHAVKALKESIAAKKKTDPSNKKFLFEETDPSPIFLNVTLKKIPKFQFVKMIKVPLPHSLLTNCSEVCLITTDLDKWDRNAEVELTVQHYKELLAKHGVTCVSQIIPLKQLRTEYSHYEARQNLCVAYDAFLADNKIGRCLPSLLGKFFFRRRKFPQKIDLTKSNVKFQIEKALSKKVFFISGRGNMCTAEVAHLGLTTKQTVENIAAAISTIVNKIPGAQKNINGIYIRTSFSLSIPLYMSLDSGNDVELPGPRQVEEVEAEEISTLIGKKVKVYEDGEIEVISNEGSDLSEDDFNGDDANDLSEDDSGGAGYHSEDNSGGDDAVDAPRRKKRLMARVDVSEERDSTEISSGFVNTSVIKSSTSFVVEESKTVLKKQSGGAQQPENVIKKKKRSKSGNSAEFTENVIGNCKAMIVADRVGSPLKKKKSELSENVARKKKGSLAKLNASEGEGLKKKKKPKISK